MRLLLLSSGLGAVPAFLEEATGSGGPLRIVYVPDAASPYAGAAFASEERDRLAALGHVVEMLPLTGTPASAIADALDRADAVYVAGGNTFALLHALRSTGSDRLLVDRVRAGLPYLGLSAGAVVAGPTIEPIAPMDDAAEAPELASRTGLGLVDVVVVPHADGASYPAVVIERIVAEYAEAYPLRLVGDSEALLVDDAGAHVFASA